MKTVITTGGRPDEQSRKLAIEAAKVLGYDVIERNKRSITRIQRDYESAVLVAGSSRYDLYRIGMEQPLFFHPNSAAFRLKRMMNGEADPLIDVAQLKNGDSFLDCTLGLGSDSIIASFVVGNSGKVQGIEGDKDVAFITGRGFKSYDAKSDALQKAMQRVQVIHMDAINFLESQPDASWDIVYIDPMFSAPIEESSNFTPLRKVGLQSILTEKWLAEAKRVSKRRVVIKDRFDSPIFDAFNFNRRIRPNTKFHFGFIVKE